MLEIIKNYAKDRPVVLLTLAILLATVAYCIYVALTIDASEILVVNQYTAFGPTNFYRDSWTYLIGFVVIGIVIGLGNIAIMAKLHGQDRRPVSILLGWLTLLLLVISFIIARSVLQVASLS